MKRSVFFISLISLCTMGILAVDLNNRLPNSDFIYYGFSPRSLYHKTCLENDVISRLGKPLTIHIDSSGGYEGHPAIIRELRYRDIIFVFWKCPFDSSQPSSLEYLHLVGKTTTKKGIKLGDTRKRVLLMYGIPDTEASTADNLIYFGINEDTCISFTIKDNKVSAIVIGWYIRY